MYHVDFADFSAFPRHSRRALTLGALLVLGACASSTGPSASIPLDKEFQLAPGQTAMVGMGGLRITFISVPVDTRCPLGVLCIVAGEAQVEIDAEQGDAGSRLRLNTDGLGRQAIFVSYAIELVNLTPTPKLNQPTPLSSYRIGLKVSLLGPD